MFFAFVPLLFDHQGRVAHSLADGRLLRQAAGRGYFIDAFHTGHGEYRDEYGPCPGSGRASAVDELRWDLGAGDLYFPRDTRRHKQGEEGLLISGDTILNQTA